MLALSRAIRSWPGKKKKLARYQEAMDYQGLILSNRWAIFSVPCPPISITAPLPQYSALPLSARIFRLLSIMYQGLMTAPSPLDGNSQDRDSDF